MGIEKCPQIRVETIYTTDYWNCYSCYFFQDRNKCGTDILLDEALSFSTTFGELLRTSGRLLWNNFQPRGKREELIPWPFNTIEEYVKQNLRQPLSLESVCSHIGISQTYLSRLFRNIQTCLLTSILPCIVSRKQKN